jgi:hypothetical protein
MAQRTRDRIAQIVRELTLVPERAIDPDTAEAIERAAIELHAAVMNFAPITLEAPANLTGLADTNPRTTFDRIAEMLRITVESVDWLDDGDDTLACWVEVAATIYLARSLRALERALMLAHELAHERRRRAPHREVLYLTLALLLPRSLVALLPPGRMIAGASLQRVCPWPAPIDLCNARAVMLRRQEEAA